MKATGFVPDQFQLKWKDVKLACILYSMSMANCKLIARATASFFEPLQHENSLVSLRFPFRLSDKAGPLAFLVPARVSGFTRYNEEREDQHLITFTFAQKPPDDLIWIIGQLLEVNANAQKREAERIIITQESARELGLSSSESHVFIESVPRKCIIRDLAFSGATILVVALAKFLINKEAILTLLFAEVDEVTKIPGKIVRHEEVVGRRDIAAFALSFDKNKIPMEYKMRINNWLSLHAHSRGKVAFGEEKVGDGLMRIGAMSKEQTEDVLQRQKNGDERLFGEIAIELGYVDDDAIMKFLIGKRK